MSLPTAAPLIAGTMTAGAKLSKGELPRLRIAIGAVAASVVLGAISGPLPGFARAFAYLIILGALLGPGYDLVKALTKLLN